MTAVPKEKLTPKEYLALEHSTAEKNEFVDGELRAMGGAGRSHTLIVANLMGELYQRLEGTGCRALSNDMRVKAHNSDNYFYPDVVAYCGRGDFRKEIGDTLLDPVTLVEVLSPSTEGYDRGEKFFYYQQIQTLQQYILVSQVHPRVEIFTRGQNGRWEYEVISGVDRTARLDSLGVEIPLERIYRDVDFGQIPPDQR